MAPTAGQARASVGERAYRLAVLPGDGIGPEVIAEALAILRAVTDQEAFSVDHEEFPWGCEYYLEHGRVMEASSLERLAGFDAILLGAVGGSEVPEALPIWGLVLPIRQSFDQWVNLRPMRLLEGVASPLTDRSASEVDMICVRENSEGEYSGVGRRQGEGRATETAEQTAVFSRRGIDRITRYAFELARSRPRRRLASATKSNALEYSMTLWDEVVEEVANDYPEVTVDSYHVDALAARMVSHPDTLDTIVASNLFGDILTDLGAAVSGSLGLAPSANLNPERAYPSMFEPIHGSAPDIAGRGIANPVGAVWATAMMLDHLGEHAAHDRIVRAIEAVLRRGAVRTPDLGGSASTRDLGEAIGEAL